ncbi:putative RNA-dependent RNA polymerase SHL2, partial [Neolecta irregularis DAH-3]
IRSDQHQKLISLLRTPFIVYERKYQLFCERDKGKSVMFFATSGVSPNLSLLELLDWHAPLFLNADQTMAKYYSRIALGLSSSKPTVEFNASQIIVEEDIVNLPNGEIMTDGCALASPHVFREVRRILNLNTVPVALQGRLGGAKGVWFMSPNSDRYDDELWIQVRRSQLKFDADWINRSSEVTRLTLDVLKTPKPPQPGTLNHQFISILSQQGVPDDVFKEELERNITSNMNEFIAAVLEDNVPRLREQLEHKTFLLRRAAMGRESYYDEDDIVAVITGNEPIATHPNGRPLSNAETCIMMLDAGFRPRTCKYMARRFRCIIQEYSKIIQEKMHMVVQQSSVLLAIADPTGTLEEGEVSIRFSRPLMDENTGISTLVVEGAVILGRNPALLPTDLQKAKAVDCPALITLTDVIVFSVKGEKSLVSLLSGGGDFDGDTIFCCWDPRFVVPFKNACRNYAQMDLYLNADEWFHRKTEKALKIFLSGNPEKNYTNFVITETLTDRNKLGQCCNLHDLLIYHLGSSRDAGKDSRALLLGHLASTLVDSGKQGLQINESKWSELVTQIRKVAPESNPPRWWYFTKKNYRSMREADLNFPSTHNWTNILDLLHCRVVPDIINKHLEHYDQIIRDAPVDDEDIDLFWKSLLRSSLKEVFENVLEEIEKIKKGMGDLYDYRPKRFEEDEEKYHQLRNSYIDVELYYT